MVGFVWEPTERTNIAVSGGQRFYGNTYAGLVTHRTRLTVWDASYNESLTTFNQQAGLGSCPTMGGSLSQLLAAQNPTFSPDIIQQNSNALLGLGFSGSFFSPTNFLTNRLFLQKTLQASVAMNGIRNTVVFRIFNLTRRAFSPTRWMPSWWYGEPGIAQQYKTKRRQRVMELQNFCIDERQSESRFYKI